MPISEDELDQPGSGNSHPSGMTKAELRKSNKPIMEKRRRARINHCLNELKSLILDAMKKDPARHSKLEKADILEMTVRHLQKIQRQQLVLSVASDPTVIQKFKSGFNECAGEVSRFIGNMEGVETGVKQRLVAHLSTCVTGLQQMSPFALNGFTGATTSTAAFGVSSSSKLNIPNPTSSGNVPLVMSQSFSTDDVNNNSGETARIHMPGGIQLIPSRLPTGELALLVPNSTNMPFFPASTLQQFAAHQQSSVPTTVQYEALLQPQSSVSSSKPLHVSAFTSVRSRSHSPSSKSLDHLRPKLSPPPSPSSSTTSHCDDHLSSDMYKHNCTPSPHVKISTPFPTPPNQSLSNLGTPPPSQNAQQSLVTSTSTDSKSSQHALTIEYQSVPIYQRPSHRQFEQPSSHKDPQQPLLVITSDRYKLPMNAALLKRPYSDIDDDDDANAAGGLLAVSQPPSPKIMRYDLVSSSEPLQRASPDHNGNPSNDSGISFESSPSTSANTSRTSANTSGASTSATSSTDSMWRPW